ncbi:unnamed protein product [Strongylus vulgaris]|uniref:Uncharacterized protein n=1 Tax=Strongylus vulgaris TaxID=40348 RepID=A0A3P7IAN1_STRVU|nr:unnamed protein product [Strongylus vulgaris]
MLGRVLRISAFSRQVAAVFAVRPSTTCTATSSPDDPLKGLIDSLSNENEISPAEKLIPFSANIKDFRNFLETRKDRLQPSDFLNVLKSALLLDRENRFASEFIKNCGKEPNEQAIMQMPVNDDLISMMTALLELGLAKEELFRNLEKRLSGDIGGSLHLLILKTISGCFE